jgi:hypothetical protein
MAISAGAKAVVGTELNREQFAAKVLQAFQIPLTRTSIGKFVEWEKAEGGHWNNTARYNPLNTTLALPGAGNTGTQGNIKVYKSWQQGIEATVNTLKAPAYAGILANLKSGTVSDFKIAVNTSPWGTKFSNLGEAIEPEAGLAGVLEGKIPGFSAEGKGEETAEHAAEDAAKKAKEAAEAIPKAIAAAVSSAEEFLGKTLLEGVLLLAGAMLVVYGIMVAVRPRESAFSLPRIPVPV